MTIKTKSPKFGYYINLDERGEFYADVRNIKGETVFEISIDGGEDCSNIFEDGFMKNKTDMNGLTDYLQELKVIPKDGIVLSMMEFESHVEKTNKVEKTTKKASKDLAL